MIEIVSQKTRISEGKEGIRRILREIYRNEQIGTKELAYITKLPVPVVAAVRAELEKIGLISRKRGAVLTEDGKKYVEDVLGFEVKKSLICPLCHGRKIIIKDEFQEVLKKMKKYADLRPKPYTWLDQAFCTPETSVLRALFMLEEGDVEGREIIFLGDDDLTSIATGLLKVSKKITVIDVDERLLELINKISEHEGISIECIHHDLRNPLPKKLIDRFDVTFTDPPYTITGMKLFVSRGIDALKKKKCASIYLSFAHKPPEDMLNLQVAISEMGLFIREMIPKFNRYEGAEIFANTTFLAKLETTEKTRPSIHGRFDGKIYTGEVSPTMRIYKCRCGRVIKVGVSGEFKTIEELKTYGCPECGRKEGFKLTERKRLFFSEEKY
ncbi:bis-aminopropyl spermidine synthase family protein [Candidatus Bathyarchaeota archaeon]|nr:bis-aminopropyl spermidine synthase family protein [Candidatus Bathyarchaeota archaeon]